MDTKKKMKKSFMKKDLSSAKLTYRILVTRKMCPIPSEIFILKDYGDFSITDFFRGKIWGAHLVVTAKPDVLIGWLKNFKDVWVSEDLNPHVDFHLAEIKQNLR